ncbi:Cysteine rich receptor like kinase [Thalictrum thalictroides]|uniref:Cysteine rich receptor like kinase n=1 Tax=Thalictrum thalictroides TaxID=46969 RepID=A0A7J6W2P0_THATH|nr:Cysteine rich receptor like kinase [Thalictrum thalictroides]
MKEVFVKRRLCQEARRYFLTSIKRDNHIIDSPPNPSIDSPPNTGHEKKSSKPRVVIVVPAVIGVIILSTVTVFFCFRKNKGSGTVVEGQKNNSYSYSPGERSQDLLSNAWRHWEQETVLEMIDPTLRQCNSISEVRRCIQIGLLCVQEDVARRPTMASVCSMLSSYSFTLPVPSVPSFFVDTEVGLNRIPEEHGTNSIRSSINDDGSINDFFPR